MITKIEENDDSSEDEFENPNIPFPDSALNTWVKDPKGIFMGPQRSIPIYLKKLELSEKGREVLAKLKKEGISEKEREILARLKKKDF